MLKVSRGLYFGEEPVRPYDCRQLRFQDLERNLPLVLQVIGEIDGCHPTLAELSLDAVSALKDEVEAGYGVGHGTFIFFWTHPACRLGDQELLCVRMLQLAHNIDLVSRKVIGEIIKTGRTLQAGFSCYRA